MLLICSAVYCSDNLLSRKSCQEEMLFLLQLDAGLGVEVYGRCCSGRIAKLKPRGCEECGRRTPGLCSIMSSQEEN